mmetsp:Transcript_31670/g.72739  ORF Transcript_31670/g.72739 Transcript_31670/m.72739 type:complete len:103 (+) Transcript_31670:209-517(+)
MAIQNKNVYACRHCLFVGNGFQYTHTPAILSSSFQNLWFHLLNVFEEKSGITFVPKRGEGTQQKEGLPCIYTHWCIIIVWEIMMERAVGLERGMSKHLGYGW